jgi:hypothetical protein
MVEKLAIAFVVVVHVVLPVVVQLVWPGFL